MGSSGQRGSCTGSLRKWGGENTGQQQPSGSRPAGDRASCPQGTRQGPGSKIKAAESFRERRAPHTLLPTLVCYLRQCPGACPQMGQVSWGRSWGLITQTSEQTQCSPWTCSNPAPQHTQGCTCQHVYTRREVYTHLMAGSPGGHRSHGEQQHPALHPGAAPRRGPEGCQGGVGGLWSECGSHRLPRPQCVPRPAAKKAVARTGEKPSSTQNRTALPETTRAASGAGRGQGQSYVTCSRSPPPGSTPHQRPKRDSTWCFLHKNDFGVLQEVVAGQHHLLAAEHGAAGRALLLHEGQLLGRPLGCAGRTGAVSTRPRPPRAAAPRGAGAASRSGTRRPAAPRGPGQAGRGHGGHLRQTQPPHAGSRHHANTSGASAHRVGARGKLQTWRRAHTCGCAREPRRRKLPPRGASASAGAAGAPRGPDGSG